MWALVSRILRRCGRRRPAVACAFAEGLGRRTDALEARVRALERPRRAGPTSRRSAGGKPGVAIQRPRVREMSDDGLSQAEIARRLGVSRQWVHKLVHGGR